MDRLRLEADKISQPIPTPGGRQFVVEKTDPSEDRISKELFWYREELFKRLRATWREIGTRRHGSISLRDLRLTMPTLEILRLDEVAISLSLDDPIVNEFATLRATVQSSLGACPLLPVLTHTARRFDALIRFEVVPTDEDDDAALSRHVLFDGVPHVVLDLQPDQQVVAELSIIFLSLGTFTLTASIEALDETDRLWICNAPLTVSVV